MEPLKAEEREIPLHSRCVVLTGQFYVLHWNLWLHNVAHSDPSKARHSEVHCCYQINSEVSRPWPLKASSQMEFHPKRTVSCDHTLDSWPGSLNLTGSWPCWRWNMGDIRFTMTLAFSRSDFHMHFHQTLTDEEFLLFWEKHNDESERAASLGARTHAYHLLARRFNKYN